MNDLTQILETAVGQAVLAKFADVCGVSPATMRSWICGEGRNDADFRAEFLRTVKRVVA